MERYGILVAGGGSAGVCAAIQAGRELGAGEVCLVERSGICGGTTTMGGINYPGIFHAWGRQVISGIGWDLVARTRSEMWEPMPDMSKSGMHEHWRYHVRVDPLVFSALVDEALESLGVELKYHTMVGRVERQERGWLVTLCGKDGLYDVMCDELVDCTGDANVSRMAGAAVREPMPCQPGTLSVYLTGYDANAVDYAALAHAYDQAMADGDLQPGDMGWFGRFNENFLRSHGNNSNHISGINGCDSEGRTLIEIAGRASMLRAYRFLRRQPGLERLGIQLAGGECGVRESRTVVGEWTVTAEEYVSGVRYPDAVCHSFYPIDLHDAKASVGIDQRKLREGVVPCVPRGALVAKNVGHLLVAGRCLSSDRLANSALRVQATCMATGQAAGAMAALSVKSGVAAMELALDDIRAVLEANGAIVP